MIIDEVQQLTDNRWFYYRFTLRRRAAINFSFAVESGGPVTGYVMDAARVPAFEEVNQRTFGGQFIHYEVLAAAAKRQHQGARLLDPGEYAVALKESSAPNLVGGSESSVVRVRVTAH